MFPFGTGNLSRNGSKLSRRFSYWGKPNTDTGGEFVFRHLSPLDQVELSLVSALKGEFASGINVW
jgi:hypothetical protein